MRFQFIEDHRERFPVIRMCEVLEVSPSGYYTWRGRPPSKREMANQELTAEIKKAFDASGEVYGSPRIYHVMRKLGLMCSENRVARLMRGAGLRAKESAVQGHDQAEQGPSSSSQQAETGLQR